MFSLEEAQAGYDSIQQEVREASAAVDAARGRSERRAAEARFADANTRLAVAEVVLEKARRRPRQAPVGSSNPPPPPRGGRHQGAPTEPPSRPTPCSKTTAMRLIRKLGDVRRLQGDHFYENTDVPGHFYYGTGAQRVGISIWGDETDWALSVYSAALVEITPSLALHQFVSRWRTTAGLGAPYVVEKDGMAAILCERSFQSSQMPLEVFPYSFPSTVDIIGGAAARIATYLSSSAVGRPVTGYGVDGMLDLMVWWDIDDPGITAFLQDYDTPGGQ